jgi:hypothetical protein
MDGPGSESCKMADYGISAIETCSSIKGREFTDWLNCYKLLIQEAPHVVRPNSFCSVRTFQPSVAVGSLVLLLRTLEISARTRATLIDFRYFTQSLHMNAGTAR